MSADDVDGRFSIRERLRRFFNRRSTRQQLVDKGILKNEAVFGNSLVELYRKTGDFVPKFIINCIQYTEVTDVITTEGLYRHSAVLSKVQKVRLEVDNGNLDILDKTKDVHVIAGSVKLFYRELQEPLIPWMTVNQVYTARAADPINLVDQLRAILREMNVIHLLNLKELLQHLFKVSRFKVMNKMDLSNLSVVFGPSLMWPPIAESAHDAVFGMQKQSLVLETLMKNHEDIFDMDYIVSEMEKCKQELLERRDSKDKFSSLQNLKVDQRFIFSRRNRSNSVAQLSEGNLRDKLTNFFKGRQVLEGKRDLMKKGIYKNNIFGSSLVELSDKYQRHIPSCVQRLIEKIESAEILKTENLYSQSGNLSTIQKLCHDIDQEKFEMIELNSDAYVLAGALKTFFRELKEPVIPWEVFEKLSADVQFSNSSQETDLISSLRETLSTLPAANHATLLKLLNHLVRVEEHKATNKMTFSNLAILFNQCLIWPSTPTLLDTNVKRQRDVLEALLTNARPLIESTDLRRKPSRPAPETPPVPMVNIESESPRLARSLSFTSRIRKSMRSVTPNRASMMHFGEHQVSASKQPQRKTQMEKDIEAMEALKFDVNPLYEDADFNPLYEKP